MNDKFKFSEEENNLVYDELDAVRYGGEEQIDIAISRIESIIQDRGNSIQDGWIDVDAVWQKCPKCDGQGIVSKPPWIAGDVYEWSSTSVSHQCNVCNGAMIIPSAPKQPKK